ncbi:MAG TPA: cytochrome P450 [Microthrixaceae bacterium]|nr:cytochrome P450 [Microthrixaceae bacterium]RTL08161.1 MAG: cytochrome P450 [Acidimicrobiia bacterium]HMU78920.1 cytochrome P450 [Microthrixaceae bacterium]HMX65123.1 cytochrome P450 [Microthrixaceae bacterium]HNE36854.1 cytochrome P450 [Microthrixaceae bacterium]
MPVPVPPGYDLTDPDIYANAVPLAEYAWLRRSAPVFWNAQTVEESSFDDGGLWVVSRHADVKAISCARSGWSSEENTAIVKFDGKTVGYQERHIQKGMLLNMDEPRHTRVRGVVSRGVFTPRGVARIEGMLQEMATQIVLSARDSGTGDFVDDIACELPLQAIAELVGFPQEDRRKIFDWSNEMMAYDDPDFDVDPAQAAAEILGYAAEMGEDRKRNPREDIVTRLVAAADEEVVSSEEFAFFVLLLAVAGNETTRNAISHGMQAFFDNPEQWERYKAERPSTTADEVVRWGTPVQMFQRTATEDTEVGGQAIAAGQRVGLLYGSANYDETVFDEPNRFDIFRDPNPHVGFGGGGVHFCPGSHLAKLEIDLMFNAIADNIPDIAPAGPQRRLRSGWLNGIKEMPVAYR